MSKFFTLIKVSIIILLIFCFFFLSWNNRYDISLDLTPFIESLSVPLPILMVSFYFFGIITVLFYLIIFSISRKLKKIIHKNQSSANLDPVSSRESI